MIRILIVDDVKSTREHLKKQLEAEAGLEVCGMADNGQAALDAVQQCAPDVVLMDDEMPVMDGIQATGMIGQIRPGTPVIIMSVHGGNDHRGRAEQAGARAFLIKPFRSKELVEAVRRIAATYGFPGQ